jgi:CHAT domain-containing protein
MTNRTEGRWLASLLLLGLTAASVLLLWHSTPAYSNWQLVTALSDARVGDGQFFRSSGVPLEPQRYQELLLRSELALLTEPDSLLNRRIKALIRASEGNLQAAASDLQELSDDYPYDPEIVNDLGVIYLSLARGNAGHYFRAAQAFDRSLRLTPGAAAPARNAALVYAKLGLNELASEQPNDVPNLLEKLNKMLANPVVRPGFQLLTADVPQYRHAAATRLLNPNDDTPDQAVQYVAAYYMDTQRDPTFRAMLEPLRQPDREHVVKARTHVQSGIEAYRHGKLEEASNSYDMASTALLSERQSFDDLWIKLNRADVELRKDNTRSAGDLLNLVIAQARLRDYKWLLGRALAAKSADPRLVMNYEELLLTLDEAVTILTAVDAPQDAARAMNYLATVYFVAGDFDKSLDMAYAALFVTPKSDHVRRAQLLVTAGIQLYRLGMQEYSIRVSKKAMFEATLAKNPLLVALTSSNLAEFDATKRDFQSAEKYFAVAAAAATQIEATAERERAHIALNLLCARIKISGGALSQAEQCLRKNAEIFEKTNGRVPYFVVQNLLHLAETHALQKRFDLARNDFRKAADVLEVDDAYLAAGGLRMSFENERRAFYEKAIAFEYDHGTSDNAWEYTQRYRSKLFLEFLGQLNPGVSSIRGAAVSRGRVQQRIPPKVQVIEYVALEDRLLIWLVSNKAITSTTVPVSRAELERKISDFLSRTRDKRAHQAVAQDLHRLLIEPIETQLQAGSTLALIPDQALHRLNFPALYSEAKKSYLIERFAILENPSLTSLLAEGTARPLRENAVAFGVQSDDTNATAELRSLQKVYSDIQTINGPSALKTAFLSALDTAGIFHYAGHSQDASDPLRSSVLLDGNIEGANSVTAIDISKHRMPPNSVVVLASCDSSVGNSRDGVGVRGLTSAFLISGAGSVVGSLWLVEANSTSKLVLAFHKSFAEDNLPVAEALRKAQLQFIAAGDHPYYWSGFVVTGNTSALQ